MDPYDAAGAIGAALILIGLYRTTIGVWSDKSLWSEVDHLFGSTLLIIYLAHSRAYIGIVINVAYMLAAIVGLRSYAEHHGKRRKKKKPR